MGNCFRRGATEKYWAGEDWGFLATPDENGKLSEPPKMEEKRLLVDCSSATSSSSSLPSAVTEVKIKITKKHLEELLGEVDIHELSVHQVVARLIDAGDRVGKSYLRPWSPGLQSIPEAI